MRPISFKRHRFPSEVIPYAVWLYFLTTHAGIYNTFNTQPHRIRRSTLR